MIAGDIRNQIDRIWDSFWSGGISNPLEVIEQITYLLFIRRLDDLHTLEENKANRLKQPMARRIFPKGKDGKGRPYEDYRWLRFKNYAPADMFTLVGEHLFGDPATNPRGFARTRLDELVREGDSINYGVVQPGNDCEDGVPLIRVGDLQNGKVEQSALKRISRTIESAYKRSRLRGHEILVSCVGSTGVIALADESVRGFNIARAVARIPLADSIDRVFMASYLRTHFVQRYFQNELRTVSQPTLNIRQISEARVLLPQPELQREFARRVGAVTRIDDQQRRSLKELDALFASLQYRAFRGEL